ncbi:MAG: hypothetical protein QOF20_1209 [Acidimicrobiaceae bacterium]|jgi:hypothetical protein|nr:hypothetical protein [Acidimicrobiaceae bacterium]MDQ1368856.1 hypothetical protein [Acidimicrobiaceae bacterium]MDQ1399117.1 hypothetical protein [Acidimicrobiaceae bacterium]MDQ1414191.1 hypothetical protein [Acidimicrobiaceae bacterium]MDQ1416876.1 hypothetical protein [Acidimicrobiaceae bacterium]
MSDVDRCFVAECDRRAAASVSRADLPGSLRLCATHTEQFRQSSDGWGITWPPGAPSPTAVTAPSSDTLWAYRPEVGTGPQQPPPSSDPVRRGPSGWLEARRGKRPPK